MGMEQELDMEVTPERVEAMKNTLLRLWIDQQLKQCGRDEETVTVTVSRKAAEKPA